ncbi:MAG: D-Ala-D-Ala carboxypeptidase family metallohydrolase [Pseudomonadota bacterium]
MTISLNEYITASGMHPERLKSFELTAQIIINAKDLLAHVNPMLDFLGLTPKVTSGFRPSSVNAALPNSAKKSAHMTGQAVDLEDKDGSLKEKCTPELLEKFGLYREATEACPGWCHLQTRVIPSGHRIFMP